MFRAIGVLLVIVGVLLLLERFGFIHGDIWDYVFPAAVIAIGIHLIFRSKSKAS
jgi:hypothetical protein